MEKKIKIELDNRYKNISDAMPEVIDYLTQQGYECNIKSLGSNPIVEINKVEYGARISQRILGPLPPQIIILEESKFTIIKN